MADTPDLQDGTSGKEQQVGGEDVQQNGSTGASEDVHEPREHPGEKESVETEVAKVPEAVQTAEVAAPQNEPVMEREAGSVAAAADESVASEVVDAAASSEAQAAAPEAPEGSVEQPSEDLGGAAVTAVDNGGDVSGKTAADPQGEEQDSEDFARMIDESKVENHSRDIKVGDKVSGVFVKIGSDNSFVDFGGRSEGIIKTSELRDEAQGDKGEIRFSEGDPIEAFVMEDAHEIILSRFLRQEDRNADFLYQAYKSGIPVEGKINATNQWGLGVDIQGVRAFCPISQIETAFVEDTEVYRDQTFSFKITEFRNQGRNIVVSRRALLEAEKDKEADDVRSAIKVGAELDGKVTRLEPFGAFVDLGGGIEGLIHVSEMTHQRVEHPQEVVQEGQDVKVAVVRLKNLGNKRKERISLSLKALEKDPWEEMSEQFRPGTVVQGKVDALEDYGAFVELAPNVRGMVHVSEMADKRVAHPREVVSVGEEVQVAVLELDRRRKRLRLSIKQVETMEDATNLKEFQMRQKKEKGEPASSGNALIDALKRAQLVD